jgi:hypothetical protein
VRAGAERGSQPGEQGAAAPGPIVDAHTPPPPGGMRDPLMVIFAYEAGLVRPGG